MDIICICIYAQFLLADLANPLSTAWAAFTQTHVITRLLDIDALNDRHTMKPVTAFHDIWVAAMQMVNPTHTFPINYDQVNATTSEYTGPDIAALKTLQWKRIEYVPGKQKQQLQQSFTLSKDCTVVGMLLAELSKESMQHGWSLTVTINRVLYYPAASQIRIVTKEGPCLRVSQKNGMKILPALATHEVWNAPSDWKAPPVTVIEFLQQSCGTLTLSSHSMFIILVFDCCGIYRFWSGSHFRVAMADAAWMGFWGASTARYVPRTANLDQQKHQP